MVEESVATISKADVGLSNPMYEADEDNGRSGSAPLHDLSWDDSDLTHHERRQQQHSTHPPPATSTASTSSGEDNFLPLRVKLQKGKNKGDHV